MFFPFWCLSSFLFVPVVQASPGQVETGNLPDTESIVDSQLENLNIDELKGFWEDILHQYGGFLPESQKGSLYDFIKGEKNSLLNNGLLGL